MSFGKMAQSIEIVATEPVKDDEGFGIARDTVIAKVRAYYEPKNSTERWRSNAVFADASAMFRFRKIPGVTVDTTMTVIHGGKRYGIISAENVRGRNMYVEILAKAVSGSS